MRPQDKKWIYLVNGLLFGVGLLFHALAADAQTSNLPSYFNQDPAYWYNQYQAEHTLAEELKIQGRKSIDGLQASLQAANDTIIRQNSTIVRLVKERNGQTDRAVKAETALEPTKKELDEYKGRTVIGKAIRKVGEGLKYVGGVTVAVLAIKAALP